MQYLNRMQRTILYLILITVFITPFANVARSELKEHKVLITDSGFKPESLRVNINDTLKFENSGLESHWPASNPHPTHINYATLDAGAPVKPGSQWKFVFTRPGNWELHDHLNPHFTMTVKVNHASKWSLLFQKIKLAWQYIGNFVSSWKVKENTKSQFALADFFTKDSRRDPVTFPLIPVDTATSCLSDDFTCHSQYLALLTKKYGPIQAIDTLADLFAKGDIASHLDDHQLAHVIGRETAHVYGINIDAFSLCPQWEYSGACVHGYFEHALGNLKSRVDAAEAICTNFIEENSQIIQNECYHGAGHGMMMATGYNVTESLSDCGKLNSMLARSHCAEGVFMEALWSPDYSNYKSAISPIACDNYPNKFRRECMLYWGMWQASFNFNFMDAARACELLPSRDSEWCSEGMGRIAGYLFLQERAVLIETGNLNYHFEKTMEQCGQLNQRTISKCYSGALQMIMSKDRNGKEYGKEFCTALPVNYREDCNNIYEELLRAAQ